MIYLSVCMSEGVWRVGRVSVRPTDADLKHGYDGRVAGMWREFYGFKAGFGDEIAIRFPGRPRDPVLVHAAPLLCDLPKFRATVGSKISVLFTE